MTACRTGSCGRGGCRNPLNVIQRAPHLGGSATGLLSGALVGSTIGQPILGSFSRERVPVPQLQRLGSRCAATADLRA